MDGLFANHYKALDLPITATRHQIRETYKQRVQDLEHALLPTVGIGVPCPVSSVKHTAVMARSDSLRVLVPKDVLKTWKGIDQVIATNMPRQLTGPAGVSGEQVWRPSASHAIIRRNELSDAYYILSHPVKKKAYDLEHWRGLCEYEGKRTNERVQGLANQKIAMSEAKKWRQSLVDGARQHGGKPWVDKRFNRVEDALDAYCEQEKSTTAISRMCGEVIAGFVDTMEE
ncbi:hypothetical protein LTR08_003848 [Meristemomyces frigidus]|nr:hypothetical protein LTR08_003848 [Meristemomyces frigidus]